MINMTSAEQGVEGLVTSNGAAGHIRQYRLDNGLRLVTAPAATGQVAAINLWYGVGSRHEVPGRTGSPTSSNTSCSKAAATRLKANTSD